METTTFTELRIHIYLFFIIIIYETEITYFKQELWNNVPIWNSNMEERCNLLLYILSYPFKCFLPCIIVFNKFVALLNINTSALNIHELKEVTQNY